MVNESTTRHCFVCGAHAVHDHHLVPVTLLSNDATVPLCARCHSLAHGGSRMVALQPLSKEAKDRRRDLGLPSGAPPFGFHWRGGRLEEDGTEQAALRDARALAEAGMPYADIAAQMNAKGYRRRNGRLWTRRTVEMSCRAMGLRRYRRHVPVTDLPPCPRCGGARHWHATGPERRTRRCDRCWLELSRRRSADWRRRSKEKLRGPAPQPVVH